MKEIYNKILLAIDDSEHATRAVQKVIELQKSFNCQVVMFYSILHPYQIQLLPISSLVHSGNYYELERYGSLRNIREGKKILNRRKNLFDKADLPVETRLILYEDPEDYVKNQVREENFDLVVVGIKGVHSKIRKVILGSVAEKVLRTASCDVLVII